MRIPYGIADFHRVVSGGYFYVDRTAGIRQLEEMGEALLFVRPPGCGKTLWVSTLASYYDLRLADEFESLFGHLEIGRDPTPLRNRYFVLQWNFSRVSATGSASEIGTSLDEYINGSVARFMYAYRDHLPGAVTIAAESAHTLRELFATLRQTPYGLYLLIDEYDSFANELLAADEADYRRLLDRDGALGRLMATLESALAMQGLGRVFITGVSPTVMFETPGATRIVRDISQLPQAATLGGFRGAELDEILEQMVQDKGGLRSEMVPATRDLMRSWYDGYRFARAAAEGIYDPAQCLYLMRHLQEHGTHPPELWDRRRQIDERVLGYLSRLPACDKILAELERGDGSIDSELVEGYSTRLDLEDPLEARRFIASQLYYYGALTHGGETAGHFQVPNLAAAKLCLEPLATLVEEQVSLGAGAR